jgi:hypothetical protein
MTRQASECEVDWISSEEPIIPAVSIRRICGRDLAEVVDVGAWIWSNRFLPGTALVNKPLHGPSFQICE